MIDDLANTAGTRQIDTDVCVVGSGVSGLAFAREFLGSPVQVLILESGGLNREQQAESLNQGQNVGVPNVGLTEGRLRVFGGTTDIWPGGCVPLTEMDFSERPWVPFSGWPISLGDIQPYYERAAGLLHVAVEAFQEDVWSVVGVDGLDFDERLLSHFVGSRCTAQGRCSRRRPSACAIFAWAASWCASRSRAAVRHVALRSALLRVRLAR